MVETIVIAPWIALLVGGAFQFALLYHAKTTLNYATFEATRAGSLNNARPNFIENAFARGMAPLYTHKNSVDEVKAGRDVVRQDLWGALPPNPPNPNTQYVRIEILNPRAEHFETSNHGIEVDDGYEIPNDNLMYRPPTIRAGVSIQDANLLKLRVTYCYPMYVPVVNKTIATLVLAATSPPDGSLEDRCLNAQRNPRLPIVAQSIFRMQSPAFREDTSPITGGSWPAPSVVWP
jgi:hypothetical protein